MSCQLHCTCRTLAQDRDSHELSAAYLMQQRESTLLCKQPVLFLVHTSPYNTNMPEEKVCAVHSRLHSIEDVPAMVSLGLAGVHQMPKLAYTHSPHGRRTTASALPRERMMRKH